MNIPIVSIAFFSLSFVSIAESWEREICFLSDDRYVKKNYQKRYERTEYKTLKTIYPKIEIVSFDTLIPENLSTLCVFKRLYISSAYPLFTKPHLEGLKAYAEAGGLIVTSSGLCVVDKNENFEHDEQDQLLRRKGSLAGVVKFSSAKIESFTVELASPLTRGLEEGKSVAVSWNTGRTINVSAEVLVHGAALYEQRVTLRKMPVVTYRKLGDGALIFLDALGEENIFLKNAVSELTLEWLVARD